MKLFANAKDKNLCSKIAYGWNDANPPEIGPGK